MRSTKYVLVTPVRNEEKTIGTTLRCVVEQTIRPQEWVIVSDGSTDRTNDIVRSYEDQFEFIRLLALEHRPVRNFASVVYAIECGIAALKAEDYEFIGLLDADIRFSQGYYEEIMLHFASDAKLGLAGGLVFDCYDGFKRRSGLSLMDIAGAVQFFRRKCFDSLGGLVALPEGGLDTVTCVQARMNGFVTRTFPELEVDHLKPRNIAEGNLLRRFRQLGVRAYAIGNHPLFEVLKCGYRCREYPFVVGGVMRLFGYSWSCCLRKERMVSPEFVRFVRREQMMRLFPFRQART